MPPATFKNDEIKAEFYKKQNTKVMERYYDDPEFRRKKLEARKALYQKHKLLGLGRFAPKA